MAFLSNILFCSIVLVTLDNCGHAMEINKVEMTFVHFGENNEDGKLAAPAECRSNNVDDEGIMTLFDNGPNANNGAVNPGKNILVELASATAHAKVKNEPKNNELGVIQFSNPTSKQNFQTNDIENQLGLEHNINNNATDKENDLGFDHLGKKTNIQQNSDSHGKENFIGYDRVPKQQNESCKTKDVNAESVLANNGNNNPAAIKTSQLNINQSHAEEPIVYLESNKNFGIQKNISNNSMNITNNVFMPQINHQLDRRDAVDCTTTPPPTTTCETTTTPCPSTTTTCETTTTPCPSTTTTCETTTTPCSTTTTCETTTTPCPTTTSTTTTTPCPTTTSTTTTTPCPTTTSTTTTTPCPTTTTPCPTTTSTTTTTTPCPTTTTCETTTTPCPSTTTTCETTTTPTTTTTCGSQSNPSGLFGKK